MKIIKLTAENIKRLKAVEINPEGTLQIVAGRNGQGKSSVLDSIWYAIGGGTAKKGTSRPIRDGETSAKVTLDLGDLKVTRSWTSNEKSTLKVTAADGAQYSSPQSLLDGLVGKLSFDPLAFTHLTPKEQRDALLDLVDLDTDLDTLDRDRNEAFEQRAEIGRRGKALGSATVDDSLPTEEQSATALIEQIQDAGTHNAAITSLADAIKTVTQERAETLAKIEELKGKVAELDEDLGELQGSQARMGEQINTDDLKKQLATVEETNAKIRANNAEREKAETADSLRSQYEHLTAQIRDIDAKKQEALARATFPVDGLGFDAEGVTYQGVPFSQASSAEQIRVSLAMAMAINPKLRVIRIMDGSLLDRQAMAQIEEMARERDFQVWIERVDENGTTGVLIEDGEVQE